MPEIFRAYGFVFMFFSHEHEPIHVHVIGKGGDAKDHWMRYFYKKNDEDKETMVPR